MSRVGKAVITIPQGVTLSQAGGEVQVKGPKGAMSRSLPEGITLEFEGSDAQLLRADDRKPTRALHGLARALVSNMVVGVTDGFTKMLEIQGVGYRAEASGKTLKLSLGFSHPVEMAVPDGIKVSVENNTLIKIEGMDRELVGQFAADVRGHRPPEPYKGKGVRYQDEHVRRKVGKAGATA